MISQYLFIAAVLSNAAQTLMVAVTRKANSDQLNGEWTTGRPVINHLEIQGAKAMMSGHPPT